MAQWQEVKIILNRTAAAGADAILARWGMETYAVDDSALLDQAEELGWGDYFPPRKSSEQITITCHFSEELSKEKLTKLQSELASLEQFDLFPGEVILQSRLVNDQDWADAWKKHYVPQRIGRILVCPSWQESEERADGWNVVIYLDPGMAFGSGTHPTTVMCLEFLQGLNLEGRDLWDVGTGSGILAIAAAKMGAQVQAVDVDPVAVQVAKENRTRNCLDFPILQGSLNDLNGQPHIIVANIVATVIDSLLPSVYQLLPAGGFFIAGGIIRDRSEEILERAHNAGLRLLRKLERGEWVSYLWQRGE